MNVEELVEWANAYQPSKARQDYDWAIAVAKQKIKLQYESMDLLDGKAEALMRYVGALVAALAAAASFVANMRPYYIAWQLPALMCFVAVVHHAMACRKPGTVKDLPVLKEAFEYVDAKGHNAEVSYFAFAAPVELVLARIQHKKGRRVTRAIKWFLRGLFWIPIAALFSLLP